MEFFFLGDAELVTAFRFIGVHGMAVKDADEALLAFGKITEGSAGDFPVSAPDANGCQVLIITEQTADWLGDCLVNWQLSDRYPLIVEIPGLAGRQEGRKTLVDSIREAVGIHV